jgi:uncharacterized membrane protein
MTKSKRTKTKPGVPYAARRYASPARSAYSEATSSPGPLGTKYSTESNPPEITQMPPLDAESKSSEKYEGSQWALLEKYILRKLNVPILVALVVSAWIFVQDNGAGKLGDWKSIFWTLKKCGVVIGICLVLIIVQWLSKKMSKK